ncbi:MAG: S8 family serine peptidase [Actinomycetota bacterium]|nr:S8 family serine peptidase [Actinomycetota bacterium]
MAHITRRRTWRVPILWTTGISSTTTATPMMITATAPTWRVPSPRARITAWGGGGGPGCSLMPVKVLRDDGNHYVWDVADGIRYAVDHGAQIINLSLGYEYPSSFLEDAVGYAHG